MKLGYLFPVYWASTGLMIFITASQWASNLLGSGMVAVGWTYAGDQIDSILELWCHTDPGARLGFVTSC